MVVVDGEQVVEVPLGEEHVALEALVDVGPVLLHVLQSEVRVVGAGLGAHGRAVDLDVVVVVEFEDVVDERVVQDRPEDVEVLGPLQIQVILFELARAALYPESIRDVRVHGLDVGGDDERVSSGLELVDEVDEVGGVAEVGLGSEDGRLHHVVEPAAAVLGWVLDVRDDWPDVELGLVELRQAVEGAELAVVVGSEAVTELVADLFGAV